MSPDTIPSAWLHNMSVPPRTTLAVRREWLGGRCFDVRPRVGTERPSSPAIASWVARALQTHGAPRSLSRSTPSASAQFETGMTNTSFGCPSRSSMTSHCPRTALM